MRLMKKGLFLLLTLSSFAGLIASTPEFDACKQKADGGDVGAMWEIAVALERGDGTFENPELAVQYYKKAGSKGHRAACQRLAYFYENGIHVSRNEDAAVYWRIRANIDFSVKMTDAVNTESYTPSFGGSPAGQKEDESEVVPESEFDAFPDLDELVQEYENLEIPPEESDADEGGSGGIASSHADSVPVGSEMDEPGSSADGSGSIPDAQGDPAGAPIQKQGGEVDGFASEDGTDGSALPLGDGPGGGSDGEGKTVPPAAGDPEDVLPEIVQEEELPSEELPDIEEPLITKRGLVLLLLIVIFGLALVYLLYDFIKEKLTKSKDEFQHF